MQGFPSNESVKEGYPPLKKRHFAVIGSNNVKTVADRYIHAAYHNTGDRLFEFINIHDLERPWTPQKDQNNLHMKFLAFNVNFSSSSSDPLSSRRPAQTGVKDSYPPKKWLFYRNYLV